MTKLPIVNFKKMNQVLINLGFEPIRQKGSHVFYRHRDGRTTTVPNHVSRDLARPLIREILREIEISPEHFVED
jgi:predicted RNA binding protein YcfA (HicA-like mRNA interferase family)